MLNVEGIAFLSVQYVWCLLSTYSSFRQIALKALSERLSQQADSGSTWPSLDDDSRPKTEVQTEQSSPASNQAESLTVSVEIDPSNPKPIV